MLIVQNIKCTWTLLPGRSGAHPCTHASTHFASLEPLPRPISLILPPNPTTHRTPYPHPTCAQFCPSSHQNTQPSRCLHLFFLHFFTFKDFQHHPIISDLTQRIRADQIVVVLRLRAPLWGAGGLTLALGNTGAHGTKHRSATCASILQVAQHRQNTHCPRIQKSSLNAIHLAHSPGINHTGPLSAFS